MEPLDLPGLEWVFHIPLLGKFSAIISSNNFSSPFCLSFPFGTPIILMLVHLVLIQRCPQFFSIFFLYSDLWQWFQPMCLSLIHSSVSFILLLIPSHVFFISVAILFISIFSRLLVSSRSVPQLILWHLGSSLLSLVWIIFQANCLSLLHLVVFLEFYLIPSFRTHFSTISVCLTSCVCRLQSTGLQHFSSCFRCLSSGERDCSNGLYRLPGWRTQCLSTGRWYLILSLWWVGQCQKVCLEVSVGSKLL